MMKRHTPAPWQHVLKRALPGSVALSIMASLLMSLTASCMACPTCTLALTNRSETTDNTPLVLLALLGAGNGNANKRIWVTGYDYTGDLKNSTNAYVGLVVANSGAPTGATGIQGADNKCNWSADPNWPGSGTYKAMIVDGANRVACAVANCSGGASGNWVLQPNTTYYQADGATEIFTTDANGVWNFATAGEWPHHIWPGALNPQVWTGLNTDWTLTPVHCSNWTDGVDTNTGAMGVSTGYPTYLSQRDIYAYPQTCSDASGNGIGRIYCVEQ